MRRSGCSGTSPRVTNDTINRMTIVGTGCIALLVFGGLCIRHNVPAIESELAARAGAALAAQRLGWAEVEMDGRDVILTGIAPDAQARASAVRTAGISGVRRVRSELLTLAERAAAAPEPARAAAPYVTRVTVASGGIVLAGAAPGEDARRRVVRDAQEFFGVAAVEARLEIADEPPADWERALEVALGVAPLLVIGEIELRDDAVKVTGLTADAAAAGLVRSIVSDELPEHFTADVQVGARDDLGDALAESPSLAARLAEDEADTNAPRGLATPTPLDAPACEAEFRATLGDERILFDTASATLTAQSRQLLSELALALKRCPSARVAIEGHTDDQGTRENNLALSQRRAEEVMRYLVGEGIGLGRLSARGFGEEQPLVPNETADDRAVNRRIEFVFEG